MTQSTAIGRETAVVRGYRAVRKFSEELCAPLEIEDFVIQSMPDASPTRWHLAHTTWFFETFVVKPLVPDYVSPHPAFEFLFNSYYNTVGKQFPRMQRGLLSRPTVAEVLDYRQAVDKSFHSLCADGLPASILPIVELGLHHEQQHQELMLTDIKHVFGQNPLFPAYVQDKELPARSSTFPAAWIAIPGGLVRVGHDESDPNSGFAFDNESPRFECNLRPFEISHRQVTCGEYLQFIKDGGYRRPELWLSMGWSTVQSAGWEAPSYWYENDGAWQEFSLYGLQPLDPHRPVTHLSYFEADAFARWAAARLPTEFEWEVAASETPVDGNFVDTRHFHPLGSDGSGDKLTQMFGDTWEWTASQYTPYPGYRPPAVALGEYNGKFMCNQFVLRGGSCATSQNHTRATYRNFFPPEARWQFSGMRLARDV